MHRPNYAAKVKLFWEAIFSKFFVIKYLFSLFSKVGLKAKFTKLTKRNSPTCGDQHIKDPPAL